LPPTGFLVLSGSLASLSYHGLLLLLCCTLAAAVTSFPSSVGALMVLLKIKGIISSKQRLVQCLAIVNFFDNYYLLKTYVYMYIPYTSNHLRGKTSAVHH